MRFSLCLAALCCAVSVAACGGGGGDAEASASAPTAGPATAPTTGTAPAPVTDSGAVSARFVASTKPGSVFISIFSQKFGGALGNFVQASNGTVTTVGDVSLGGTPVVHDVAGDATFAMGRWAGGIVSSPQGTETFASNTAYHYLLFNFLPEMPVAGTLVCDGGKFTSPNYMGGSATGDPFGKARGSAALAFSAGQATATVSLVVDNADSTATKTVTAGALAPGITTIPTGSIGTGADLVSLSVGQADGGAVSVQGSYMLNLRSGARYSGVFRFRCA